MNIDIDNDNNNNNDRQNAITININSYDDDDNADEDEFTNLELASFCDIYDISYNTDYENHIYTPLKNSNSNHVMFDDENIQQNIIHSNSPITISEDDNSEVKNEYYNENNSESNSEYYSGSDDEYLRTIRKDRIKNQVSLYKYSSFKKKDYNEIENSLCKYYDNDNKYSSKLDILITFIKGQKNIFLQSKSITQFKLNFLMVPILIISAFIAVSAPFIQNNDWSGGFISGLNVIISSFISIMNYMKYETKVEMFAQIANNYDKMEISLEMSNSKLLFIENENEKNKLILSKLSDVEHKINELKEIYNILIPDEVRHMFPIICNLNILSLIKKMEKYRKNLIHKFKDVKNEIRYIIYKWKKNVSLSSSITNLENLSNIEQIREKNRLLFLYDIKEKIKDELVDSKKIYDYVEEIFTKEIKNAEHNNKYFFCFWNKKRVLKSEINPLLNKHFHFIFEDM
jgi:hypothetical protein